MAGIWFEFGTKMANVNANRFDIVIGIVTPNFPQNFAGGNSLSVTLQKTVQ
jgi:hypothetical protein